LTSKTRASRCRRFREIPCSIDRRFIDLDHFEGWFGVVAPRGTSNAAIELVNKDLGTGFALPGMVERFDTLGAYVRTTTPAQFGAYWADERNKWEKVLKDVGAQPVLQ
jgi:tripartite-type tricarboxylate transporter receptor subunit TctC